MLNVKKKKKIGIMGGTFDPLHIAHLISAETVKEKLNLDFIIFVPSGDPPHKKNRKITNKQDRFNMVMLGTLDNNYFKVSDIEMKRNGFSYTSDTLEYFKKIYEKDEFYFIMGADVFITIESWHNTKKLFELSKLVVTTRPSTDQSEIDELIDSISKIEKVEITKIQIPALDISSTDIRRRLKQNDSIKYLVPEKVEMYIYKNELYRS